MPGISDYEFQQPESPQAPTSQPRSRVLPIAAAVAAITVGMIGGYFWYARDSATEPVAQARDPQAALQPAESVENVPRYDLPPLEDSDEFMREQMSALSSHPLMAAWLESTDLVRNLAVVLENTSRGATPSLHLRLLRPMGEFLVVRQGSGLVIAARSYERFNAIAAAAASIDPRAAAALYTGIKPLLQLAYDQLGSQEPIDRALERAISGLMRAPIVEGNIGVVRGTEGVGFQYTDPRLENLSGSQKQLIRMGPANQQTIQDQLMRFAAALSLTVQ